MVQKKTRSAYLLSKMEGSGFFLNYLGTQDIKEQLGICQMSWKFFVCSWDYTDLWGTFIYTYSNLFLVHWTSGFYWMRTLMGELGHCISWQKLKCSQWCWTLNGQVAKSRLGNHHKSLEFSCMFIMQSLKRNLSIYDIQKHISIMYWSIFTYNMIKLLCKFFTH